MENAIKSLTQIVILFDKKLDRSAKFPEVQAVIDAISASMQGYKGKADKRLPLIKKLNIDARVNYTACVGPVFEWCSSMNSTLDISIQYIDEGMSLRDRRMAWNLAGRFLRHGLEKTTLALDLLRNEQMTMGYLETELKDLVNDIGYDFSPVGEYGKITRDLVAKDQLLKGNITQEVKNQKDARQMQLTREEQARELQRKREAEARRRTIWSIFSVVISIVTGPIGVALGFPRLFQKAGLTHQLTESTDPFNYEIKDQARAIQLFFNELKNKTAHTANVVKEVKEALEHETTHLEHETTHLDLFKNLITAADRNRVALLSHNEKLRRDLIPTFRDLGDSCLKYTNRHSASIMLQSTVG